MTFTTDGICHSLCIAAFRNFEFRQLYKLALQTGGERGRKKLHTAVSLVDILIHMLVSKLTTISQVLMTDTEGFSLLAIKM